MPAVFPVREMEYAFYNVNRNNHVRGATALTDMAYLLVTLSRLFNKPAQSVGDDGFNMMGVAVIKLRNSPAASIEYIRDRKDCARIVLSSNNEPAIRSFLGLNYYGIAFAT